MSDIHKSTRLGDLLIERGVITRRQALIAIEVQQKQRLDALQSGNTKYVQKELGEILIELGFINRRQLTSGLNWQKKLRKTTLAMAFVAPFLMAGCGGGGKESSPSATQSSSSLTISDEKASTSSESSSSSQVSINVPVGNQAPGTSVKSPDSASSSSAPNMQPAPDQLTTGNPTPSATYINGPAIIYWTIPSFRENGDELYVNEIGGYELRYKSKSDSDYTVITINDSYREYYEFDYLEGEYEFEIATFDTSGLYSNFVAINPQ